MDDNRRLVYSTDGGWNVPQEKACKPGSGKPSPAPDDGIVRVSREKRRTSAITVVSGVPSAQIDGIGKELKRLCGAGGTVKEGRIEIQGDHRDRIVAFFQERGARVKRAGG